MLKSSGVPMRQSEATKGIAQRPSYKQLFDDKLLQSEFLWHVTHCLDDCSYIGVEEL